MDENEWTPRARVDRLLHRRVNQARLDPWGAMLVVDLGHVGFWDARLVAHRELLTGSKAMWDALKPPGEHVVLDPAVSEGAHVVGHLVSIQRQCMTEPDGNVIVDAENFVAEALLDYFEHCARPVWLGWLRRLTSNQLTGALAVGDPEQSAKRAAAWWVDFHARRRNAHPAPGLG